MLKAVISLGNKQYIVSENQELLVEKIKGKDTLKLEPLLVIDGDKAMIGQPSLKTPQVEVKVIGEEKDDKVIAIRYKAKKRVHKLHGHRQQLSRIRVTKIN